MTFTPIILAILLQSPIGPIQLNEENHPKIIHGILSVYVTAQFADVATTEYALGTGRFKENNPLIKWTTVGNNGPIRMAIVKGSITSITTYLLLKYHKAHPVFISIIASSLTMITSWAAWQNSKLINER